MAYCRNCGSQIVDGAKFCQKCGTPVVVNPGDNGGQTERRQEFEGKIYKCPNCGEVLKSFTRNCPTCGFELRGVKGASAVREFALKMEAIELKRASERKGLLGRLNRTNDISSVDEQKISLIQSFTVPNTKEDMLEFMILATSNVNYNVYKVDYYSRRIEKEKAVNEAWVAKIKQVYNKAKVSYGSDVDFQQIEMIYNNCMSEIKTTKRKSIRNLILLIAAPWILIIALIMVVKIIEPGEHKKEQARLEKLEQEVRTAIDNGEYKRALLNAEGLDYKAGDDEADRQWDITRELLYDEIIEKAEAEGIELERPLSEEEKEESELQAGKEKAKMIMDAFKGKKETE